jgi:hypothetical protein
MSVSKFEVILFAVVSLATLFAFNHVEVNEQLSGWIPMLSVIAGYLAVATHKVSDKYAKAIEPADKQ